MPLADAYTLPGDAVPYPDGVVPRPGEEGLAVRRKGDGGDRHAMPLTEQVFHACLCPAEIRTV